MKRLIKKLSYNKLLKLNDNARDRIMKRFKQKNELLSCDELLNLNDNVGDSVTADQTIGTDVNRDYAFVYHDGNLYIGDTHVQIVNKYNLIQDNEDFTDTDKALELLDSENFIFGSIANNMAFIFNESNNFDKILFELKQYKKVYLDQGGGDLIRLASESGFQSLFFSPIPKGWEKKKYFQDYLKRKHQEIKDKTKKDDKQDKIDMLNLLNGGFGMKRLIKKAVTYNGIDNEQKEYNPRDIVYDQNEYKASELLADYIKTTLPDEKLALDTLADYFQQMANEVSQGTQGPQDNVRLVENGLLDPVKGLVDSFQQLIDFYNKHLSKIENFTDGLMASKKLRLKKSAGSYMFTINETKAMVNQCLTSIEKTKQDQIDVIHDFSKVTTRDKDSLNILEDYTNQAIDIHIKAMTTLKAIISRLDPVSQDMETLFKQIKNYKLPK